MRKRLLRRKVMVKVRQRRDKSRDKRRFSVEPRESDSLILAKMLDMMMQNQLEVKQREKQREDRREKKERWREGIERKEEDRQKREEEKEDK